MATVPPREQFLVICAQGPLPMELAKQLYRICSDNRCTLETTRMSRHGQNGVLTLQVSGNWDALARLESALPSLAKRQEFQYTLSRTTDLPSRPQALPYVAYISAAYRPDIMSELCQFFSDHQVELESMTCDTYYAPQTGGTMLNASMTLTLSAGTQISWLRDQFLDFADALNLDALIEPWRPHPPY